MNILASEDELYASKDLLDQYAKREEPAGTTDEQLWSDNEDVESNPLHKNSQYKNENFLLTFGVFRFRSVHHRTGMFATQQPVVYTALFALTCGSK